MHKTFLYLKMVVSDRPCTRLFQPDKRLQTQCLREARRPLDEAYQAYLNNLNNISNNNNNNNNKINAII